MGLYRIDGVDRDELAFTQFVSGSLQQSKALASMISYTNGNPAILSRVIRLNGLEAPQAIVVRRAMVALLNQMPGYAALLTNEAFVGTDDDGYEAAIGQVVEAWAVNGTGQGGIAATYFAPLLATTEAELTNETLGDGLRGTDEEWAAFQADAFPDNVHRLEAREVQ